MLLCFCYIGVRRAIALIFFFSLSSILCCFGNFPDVNYGGSFLYTEVKLPSQVKNWAVAVGTYSADTCVHTYQCVYAWYCTWQKLILFRIVTRVTFSSLPFLYPPSLAIPPPPLSLSVNPFSLNFVTFLIKACAGIHKYQLFTHAEKLTYISHTLAIWND